MDESTIVPSPVKATVTAIAFTDALIGYVPQQKARAPHARL
jgi:hypothetical protein